MDHTPATLPIAITERALREALHIYRHKNIPQDYALRVGMKSGGCGAAGFFIGFDRPQAQDLSFEAAGMRVLVDKRHYMYLLGMELDFEEREQERGFVFNKLE
jgi:iron-sulfur cluster assembly protein